MTTYLYLWNHPCVKWKEHATMVVKILFVNIPGML
uniref:Uncharacterized protein n=1 Tax=Rhizophora mucronata TaxID=61149 RepID=A0A2P2Q0D5_RHIMU